MKFTASNAGTDVWEGIEIQKLQGTSGWMENYSLQWKW
jgi:hypothetical protein